ncbi:hypothetical protein LUI11_00245 [Bradyrhizobium diazoefficiens]|uniref:Uncharacterized protein n=1 Tax=Bradyrhizobium diazoefficiens SEMIA 5080 TaxID=754504 RepID=A0A837CKV4_9BRAD|nr:MULTISPECIES: hypothetical protein [Bradyrhizobium]APO53539.1 hypothetical protein BD122_24755 [Bradyrhizobium diazoefficiens]KGJ69940.1 hypothetical protein BJA5080_04294 [Bradyrhizobium diazoefficiens SEMIA 5080]MCD9295379.1 hypothetical protein [Bradyrhizobium diazoefficiens]MCD9809813.1 hypothetical protein [Bradyrhizobium diazoefficiens]MCD9827242.1 hypothetical protein [Bradyrhizobium diazoefficiens]
MDKILEKKVEGKADVYLHNHLANSAYWFKQQIEKKIESGDRSGIAFDYLACATSIAFTNEAHINFFGMKCVKGFVEREPIEAKVATVFTAFKMPIVWETRPLSSFRAMKNLRDTLAHGKPAEIRHNSVTSATPDQQNIIDNLKADWQKALTHEPIMTAYKDMDDLFKQLLEKSGLSLFDTIEQTNYTISLIERKQA